AIRDHHHDLALLGPADQPVVRPEQRLAVDILLEQPFAHHQPQAGLGAAPRLVGLLVDDVADGVWASGPPRAPPRPHPPPVCPSTAPHSPCSLRGRGEPPVGPPRRAPRVVFPPAPPPRPTPPRGGGGRGPAPAPPFGSGGGGCGGPGRRSPDGSTTSATSS